jgi:hypothetical protein
LCFRLLKELYHIKNLPVDNTGAGVLRQVGEEGEGPKKDDTEKITKLTFLSGKICPTKKCARKRMI